MEHKHKSSDTNKSLSWLTEKRTLQNGLYALHNGAEGRDIYLNFPFLSCHSTTFHTFFSLLILPACDKTSTAWLGCF